MRVLMWHVHGSWTTSFLQGPHEYLLPVLPDRGADGRGRARTWDWPGSAVEVPVEELAGTPFDVVVLQRPEELGLLTSWTGKRPGIDVPAVYLEHNAPGSRAATTRHPLADQVDVPVVHVTHFNRLMWDCGDATTHVVEHGIVDPGHRFTGELGRAAVAVNEPVRRGRAVGLDLLPRFAEAAPLDVFGMRVHGLGEAIGVPPDRLGEHEDLPQERMHAELARRRVYVHPHRWTSLGLGLLEAMHLGLPVVCLATTEAAVAVPPAAGAVGTDVDELVSAVRRLVHDPVEAAERGQAAREAALARYSLGRFLADWEALLDAVVKGT